MDFVYGKDVPVHIRDNWLSAEEQNNVLMYCRQANYTFGEKDDDNVAPTDMSAEIRKGEFIYRFFYEKTQPLVPNLCLLRMYLTRLQVLVCLHLMRQLNLRVILFCYHVVMQ